ncbi:MAG: zf-HC2 domain-containing protein [Acidimicrobiia bacterium]
MTDHAFLSGYLDDELTAEERIEVEAQLAESAELRAELDEVRTARDAVRALPQRDAPAGFWEAVVAEVEAGDVVSIESRRRRVPVGWIAGAAAVAAAIIAVIVVPGRTSVRPNVTAVATQHGASSSKLGDSISSLAPVGPLVGRR